MIFHSLWPNIELPAASLCDDSARSYKTEIGACGYLLPSCEAQVVDLVSQKPLGVGETGELWVREPNVMKG